MRCSNHQKAGQGQWRREGELNWPGGISKNPDFVWMWEHYRFIEWKAALTLTGVIFIL